MSDKYDEFDDLEKEIIEEINPFIEIELENIKVNDKNLFSIIKNINIIVEAFDEAETKAMLINEILCIYR